MGLWETLRSTFEFSPATPTDVRRLNANSQSALSSSLKALPKEERGWISFAEARSLFSAMDHQYAFGEMDEQGRANLASFAAEQEHQSTFDFMPTEGRLYFTRK
jgi:hypothetical protein